MVETQIAKLLFNQELQTPQELVPDINPIIVTDALGISLNAKQFIPVLNNQEKMITNGIEYDDKKIQLPLPISPISTDKSPQFRRRHSVSGANSFTRPEYKFLLASPNIGTIEERRSIFLEKSIVLD